MEDTQNTQDVKDVLSKIKAMDEQPVEPKKESEKKPTENKPKGLFYQRILNNEVTAAEIPDEIRQEWVRSILGDIPFAYTVPLLGGRIGMVFSELDEKKSEIHRTFVRALGPDIELQTRLCIVLFLREITGDVSVKVKPTILEQVNADLTPAISINKAYDELCAQMPVGISKMLFGAWSIYSTLVGLMTQDAFPDSF